ncbi:MAG: hypothetical protein ACPGYV_05595 [Phycisphaeraceae bacterium]
MKRLLALLCCPLLCSQAIANTAELLGPDLEPKWVEIRTIAPELIRVDDGRGEALLLDPDEVLRLTLSRNEPETRDPGRSAVYLRDGQVLVGTLIASNDDEAVRLKLDANRAAQVPLDEMLSLAIERDAQPPAVDEDDALLLATGEVLTGFVETVTKDGVGFVVGDADDAIEIPMSRIRALSIANKPRPAQAKTGTLRVETTDGAVLLLEDATLTPEASNKPARVLTGVSSLPIFASRRADDGVSTEAAKRLSIDLSRVLSIEPVSTRFRLMPLSSVAMEVVSGGAVFGVQMLPRIDSGGAIRLHAPTTLRFDLPDGATRLAMTVGLDLSDDLPGSRRKLAGCTLRVYLDDRAIAEHALTPDGPAKRLNLSVGPGALRVAIDPGINGPVLDRVRISDAGLLVSE